MKSLLASACALAALTFTVSAAAQVLMLDFGPNTAAGDDRLNSPYHTANGSFDDTKWNTIGTSDALSGLRWSNDTGATSVSVNLGATTTNASRTIGLTNTPSGTTLTGTAMTTGNYLNTAPGRDGIFTGSQASDTRAVGVQVGGLNAGTYDIYITGRNTNTTAGHSQNFYAGKSSAAGDFDFSNSSVYATKQITYFAEPTTQESSWIGTGGLTNYAKFSVTLTSGEYLNLAVLGGTSQSRGFLNSIQIVNTTIPEPSAFAALAGAGTLAFVLVRRNMRPRA